MNKKPEKKYHCRVNEIIKHGDIAYIVTRNLPPETIIIDSADIEKVNKYSWSAHAHLNGKNYICHRYRDIDGKWKIITLASILGYGHGWKHTNGNVYDFRKENMVVNNPFNKKLKK